MRRAPLPLAGRALCVCAAMWVASCGTAAGPERGALGDGDLRRLTGDESAATLLGTVTIGPLCPVESLYRDPVCEPTPDLYSGVKLFIRTGEGELVRAVDLDRDGHFAVQLAPGTYLVTSNYGIPGGRDQGGDLPDGGGSGEIGAGDEGGAVHPDTGALPPAPVPPRPPVPAQPPADSGLGSGEPRQPLPFTVELEPGEVRWVDLDIDTGIR